MSTNAKVTAAGGFLTSLKLCRDAQQSCQTQQWVFFIFEGKSFLRNGILGFLG